MSDRPPTETKGMKPIWYFVGILLVIIGSIVFVTGVVGIDNPPEGPRTVLYELHTGVWWGAVIIVTGFVLLWTNRNVTIE